MMLNQLERWISPIKKALQTIVRKAIIISVDDSNDLQLITALIGKNQKITNIERLQQFGLTSVPENSSEAVILSVAGQQEHAVAVAVDSSSKRPKNLSNGDVCLYANNTTKIVLSQSGDISIETTGNINIGGTAVNGAMLDTIITKFNSHTHLSAAVGSPTSTPATSTPSISFISGVDSTTKTKVE